MGYPLVPKQKEKFISAPSSVQECTSFSSRPLDDSTTYDTCTLSITPIASLKICHTGTQVYDGATSSYMLPKRGSRDLRKLLRKPQPPYQQDI